MKSHFYHIQVNVDFAKSNEFYKELMKLLGWEEIYADETMAGYKSGKIGDLWFIDAQKKEQTDYDKLGVNHFAIRVEKQSDVDEVVEFIKSKEVEPLFETPRHRPDFASSEDETYYQVIFETPDRVQVEIVYIGAKQE